MPDLADQPKEYFTSARASSRDPVLAFARRGGADLHAIHFAKGMTDKNWALI